MISIGPENNLIVWFLILLHLRVFVYLIYINESRHNKLVTVEINTSDDETLKKLDMSGASDDHERIHVLISEWWRGDVHVRGFIIIVTRYVRLDTPPVILSSGSTLDLGSKSGCTVRHGASDEVGPDPSEHRPPDEIRWFNVHPEQISHAAADSLKSRCITLRWKGCSRDKAERLSVQINLQLPCAFH